MGIVRGIISPHPPIIVPEVGKGEGQKAAATVQALEEAASVVKDIEPEVIIFVTPHGTVFQDAVAVVTQPCLTGNLAQFGAGQIDFNYHNDVLLAEEIVSMASSKGIGTVALGPDLAKRYGVSLKLDHGITVPLYYIKKAGVACPIVPISMGFLPFEELYRFGATIREAVEKTGRRAVFVASGDLSHRLTPDAPAGYHHRGKEYDQLLVEYLKKGDIKGLVNMDQDLVECAGECGLRSFVIMFGAFDGFQTSIRVLSYQGPFGVGYLVADVVPGDFSSERQLAAGLFKKREEKMKQIRSRESAPVALARETLETFVRTGRIINAPKEIRGLPVGKAGVFVSIKKHGQLRGCIGTIEPTQPSVGEEIIQNAISAGTRDPRFDPVREEELDSLTYSVDILNPPEPISGINELNPKKYGVIVRSGGRSGLLLPNLEGVDTAEEQVAISMRKAGISRGESITMERFEVVRYY